MQKFWVVTLIGLLHLFPTCCWGHEYTRYSPEEVLAMKRIQSILGEEFKNYKGPFRTPGYIIHVLRARHGDVDGAVDMIRDIYRWRRENNIDNILKEDFSKFRKQYPYWIDHGAYDGQPIGSVPVWNIRKIMLGGHQELVIRYIDRIFEEANQYALNATKMHGKEITQGIIIIDLSAYSSRTHACLACMPFYTDFLYHFENYYPQSTSATFLVNTPRIFTHLLELLRPLMSEYTQSTLRIYGVNKEEYRAALLKLIPIERLRTKFGGKLRD